MTLRRPVFDDDKVTILNRPYMQAIAILMGTIATTVIAAEWRWEPESAGSYLVIVAPTNAATSDDLAGGRMTQRETVANQVRRELH